MIYDLNLDDKPYKPYNDIYNTFDEDVTNSNNNNKKTKIAKQIHFLLCRSCFWCASCLNVSKRTVTNCPSCPEVRLESMPISD